MLRTTVYLEDEIALAIRQLAETQKRSQADIIRDALRKYIKQTKRQGRLPLSGVGAYHSGRSDISEKAEELLKKAARKTR
jgi:predicted transcriptional regulator